MAEELDNALTTLKASTESFSHDSKISDIDIVISDLDAIFDGIVTSRVDPDQLSNSTIQALTIVELLDRVLINYGDAVSKVIRAPLLSNFCILLDTLEKSVTYRFPDESINLWNTITFGTLHHRGVERWESHLEYNYFYKV